MDSRAYLIDQTRWPLVRIVVPAQSPDSEGFERHLAGLDALLQRREPFVVVLDARAGDRLPTEQRERLRQHRRAAFFETQRYQRGIAFVVSSAFQRAVLSAILWLAPEPSPSKIFATVEEAETWAMSYLVRNRAA